MLGDMRSRIVLAAAVASLAGLLMVVAAVSAFTAREPVRGADAAVRDLRCRWEYSTHTVAMTATVVNDGDSVADYAYQVDYLTKGGKRIGSGTLIVNRVRPGQTAAVTGVGDFVPGEVPARCLIGLE